MKDTYHKQMSIQCQFQCLTLAMESACCSDDLEAILYVLKDMEEKIGDLIEEKTEREPYDIDSVNEELKKFTQGFAYRPPNCS